MPQSDLASPSSSPLSPTAINGNTHISPAVHRANGTIDEDARHVVKTASHSPDTPPRDLATTNGIATHDHEDSLTARKRKLSEIETPDKSNRSKPISPPWKKIAADGPTALHIGGRRVSARANPDLLISGNTRSKSPTLVKKEKPVSPPWKLVTADGPTARIVDGRRVSTRIASSPQSDLAQPSPRTPNTRVSPPWKNVKAEGPAAQIVNGRRVSSRAGVIVQNGDATTPNRASDTRRTSPPWKKIEAAGPTRVMVDGRRKSTRTSATEEENVVIRRPGRPPKADKFAKQTTNFTSKTSKSHKLSKNRSSDLVTTQRSARHSRHDTQHANGEKPRLASARQNEKSRVLRGSVPHEQPPPFAKIRLRVRGPAMLQQHPTHYPLPKACDSLSNWLAQDDALEGEALPYTEESLRREAAIRVTIARAAEDNGVLSDARCTRFALRPFPDPIKKYGHQDHIANHAVYFAFLRRKEIQRHMQDAARIAKAVEHAVSIDARWAFLREAKSVEQLWEEQFSHQKKRYAQLIKDLASSWNLVRQEVDRVKFAQWEKEQDALGKKHLDEMLDHSKFVLDQQFRESSTDITSINGSIRDFAALEQSDTDSGHESSATSGAADDDDENLSDSSVEEEEIFPEADDDTALTQDELRQKYATALQQELSASDNSTDDESGSIADSSHIDSDSEDEQDQAEVTSHGFSVLAASPTLGDRASIYDALEIDEVDSQLLDDSDESTDMSSNMGDTEDENESFSDSDDETGAAGLAGFLFSKEELLEAQRGVRPITQDDASGDNDVDTSELLEVTQSKQEMGNVAADIELSSGQGSEMNFSAASTWQEQDANVSTPTTSMIPGTPKRHRIEVSSLLRGNLREYQHDGVNWLAHLYAGGRNGILADEMGLGKTIQTIALLAHLATEHEVWGPHLVVVPTSVMLNWEMEFKKWCPSFKILTYYGDVNERKRKRRGWNNDDMWNVCITSYNIILQDQQVFKRRGWHYLVLDEAHNIKNFQSQRWQTLLTFRTHSRLLLTGTPLQNNLQELWSLLYFLMPAGVDGEGFADLEKFLNTMKRPADQILDQGREELDAEAQARVSKLHEILRPFLLRRLKADVEKQMPSKYEHVVYCRLSKRQRQLYDEFMGRADTKRTLASGNYMSIINCLMSLRKVCNHPDLFETRQIVTSFAMQKSATASFEIKDLIVRRNLLGKESLDLQHCGLLLAKRDANRERYIPRLAKLEASARLNEIAERERSRLRSLQDQKTNGVQSVILAMAIQAQENIVNDVRRIAAHSSKIAYQRPVYGRNLVELLTLPSRWDPPRPSRKLPEYTHGAWYLDKCIWLENMFPTVQQISARSTDVITKFSCITPAVVAEDILHQTLGPPAQQSIQRMQRENFGIDPYHEPRIRQSIAFPDKRLLQFDCGKLQALDKLLRDLQAGGHRCLIFTQMTRVLDILEQFLNIHGHRYLRLDGSTKVEQRQILTDRFNQDTRILAFILSSRSGGLGINLTGADTVIFYDLDWNPAMDKQCQDRCHRIGQTRDVHIYRFVSEYTIEANILRKSNQKRLLDDVIIQRGDFTTDMFERVTYKDALDGMMAVEDARTGEDANASAALDRFLGNIAEMGNVLDNVEDKEDAAAAKAAQKEAVLGDGVDFDENTAAARASALAANPNAAFDAAADEATREDDERPHVDEYMVRFMTEEMRWDPIRLAKPAVTKRSKKATDWRRKR